MKHLFRRLRGILVAIAALALSAGLAFGAQPEAAPAGPRERGRPRRQDRARQGRPAGRVDRRGRPTKTLEEDEDTDEDVDEDVEEEGVEDGRRELRTDPTTLTEEELAELKHGSIVCWAAHQNEWPEWFANHGAFVKCWAHHGKADAPSCTEDPTAEVPEADEDAAAPPPATATARARARGRATTSSRTPWQIKSLARATRARLFSFWCVAGSARRTAPA